MENYKEVVAALGVDYQLPSSLIAADAGRMWVGVLSSEVRNERI